jgi:hypothetical protein
MTRLPLGPPPAKVNPAIQRVLANVWLPIERAALCLDCEALYGIGEPSCPACSSTKSATLSTWLAEKRRA